MKIQQLPKVGPHDFVVDNSILTTVPCDTQAAMRHVLHLTAPTEGVELRAGSDVHLGLARWLASGGNVTEALKTFDASYKPYAAKHLKSGDRLAWAPVRRVLAYWLEAPDRGPNFLKQWHVEASDVEVPVWAPLMRQEGPADDPYTGTVYIVALLDAIGKKKVGGGKWSIDHKTTKYIGGMWQTWQEDGSQFAGQMWAAAHGPRKLLLGGIYVNGIELPELNSSDRTCPKHGTTYAKCAAQHAATKVFPITKTQHEIGAWEKTARKLTKRYLYLREHVRDVHDVRELPMQGRFIGMCSRCTFRDWCRQGRQAAGVREFVEQPWNPLEHIARGVKAAALTAAKDR